MRLVQINACDFGSTGKIMFNIADVAKKEGIDTYTFSSKREAKNFNIMEHVYIDTELDYKIHMLLGVMFGFQADLSYFATKRLIKKLKKIAPDIIHLHNIHGWYLNNSLLFKYIRKNNIKVIWTLHDCWTFTGRCPYFQITGCDKWKTGCYDCCYDRKMYPASFYFDISKFQYKKKKKIFTQISDITFITPSKWLANLVKESYLKDYPVKVINNGIDLNVFTPRDSDFRERYNLNNKKIVLGVAMGWGKRKGFDVFIELAKRLKEDYQIVLVGTNDEDDSQLPENVISIHGTNNQTELAEIYSAADVFAMPTKEDNFPTVNIEALACGTPVVTYNTGGSPEIIDETCGTVVEYDNIDEFEKEIRRVCVEKPYLKESCVKRAKKFNMNDKFREYVELYKAIAST